MTKVVCLRMRGLGILLWLTACGASSSQLPVSPPAVATGCAPCPEQRPCIVATLPCTPPPAHALVTSGDDSLRLQEVHFADLPGWTNDEHGKALAPFLASCDKLALLADDEAIGSGPYSGKASDWRPACDAASQILATDHGVARKFFETHFRPYAALGKDGPVGKLTGYYVQPLRASRKRGGAYQFPIYRRPADLVAVALSDFIDDGRGRRIWGRLADNKETLIPHLPRAEYRQQHLDKDNVLLWLDSPADALLLEIEGSGKALLDDKSSAMVAFAGKNGHSAQGRARSILRAVQSLGRAHKRGRAWTKRELSNYHSLVDQKDSMVFFEIEARDGAIGTQDVVLTPKRSLAVDRAVIALSTPIWVDASAPNTAKGPIEDFRHLVIAQDTGGAIVGSVRGDIYFGDDQAAVDMGRRVRSDGRLWLLLPTGFTPTAAKP